MSPSDSAPPSLDTVVLDVDGTLVDSVYQHTMAWAAAFAAVDLVVPLWRAHRAIGMGGDRFVAEVVGEEAEAEHGDELRKLHDQRFGELLDGVRPLPGAGELLDELHRRGFKVVLASSGIPDHTERLLALFDGSRRADDVTTSGDVETSKPAPDLVQFAIEKVGGAQAAVIGDAVWDIAAANKAGLPSIGLRCGGFGEAELLDAGAEAVFADPQALLDHLDETLLRRPTGSDDSDDSDNGVKE
ncbi:MAG: HAD family hydrolase [Nocardioidaceae bacterium]